MGPTASGKSALALELAKRQAKDGRGSIIINADSAQVYSDLQILSARPSEEEMQGFDHRLYGYIDGEEACSAAKWADDTKTVIAEAHQQGVLPILVGGTGLYVRTLLEGISPVPKIDPVIRTNIRALDGLEAYNALLKEDALTAERINPNDTSRAMRALEVIRSTGETLGYWQQNKTGGIGEQISLSATVLLPPRDWLYERCDRRFHTMMENGAVEEVETLVARHLPEDRPVMRAIGVPEIRALLAGKIEEALAIERAQTATRQYAKRQYTWFRNQSPTSWRQIDCIISDDNIADIVI